MALIRHYPDVLDCIANLSNDEVFTPPVLVNKVLDMLPLEVWSNPNLKWLDPSCKTGIFLREIAKRLWHGLSDIIPNESERKKHIFTKMIWGIAITELTSLSSRRSLYYSKNPQSSYSIFQFDNSEGNIAYENIQHTFKGNECIYCGVNNLVFDRKDSENNELHAYNFIHKGLNDIFKGNDMKFDVIVGNPPYQINDGGHGASASPLYHLFIESAKNLNPKYISMIIPARWYSSGKGLDKFRNDMLSDTRMKKLVDFTDANECFPGVEIKGGICYFLWDKDNNSECEVINNFKDKESSMFRSLNQFDVFIRFNKGIKILEKVQSFSEPTLSQRVLSRNPFGLATNFSEFKKKPFDNSICLYARSTVGYINISQIEKNTHIINKYKVLIPKAGEGDGKFPNKIIGKPLVVGKNSCCTETYLVAGFFDKEEEAINFGKYLNTKFVRFLIGLVKTTQDTTKDKFTFVPDLSMNQSWSDQDLYDKYKLNTEEVEFIESMIKSME